MCPGCAGPCTSCKPGMRESSPATRSLTATCVAKPRCRCSSTRRFTGDLQQRREALGPVGKQLRDMRDLERRGIARRHDVGHVHVTGRAPRHDRAAPFLVGGIVEAGDRARGHVARPVRLMIVRRAAAVGRPAGRAHVVADALQQHDRQADHLGVAQHVAAEPEGDAVGGYIHFASSSSLSCNRAKILTRGNSGRVLLGRQLLRLVEGALLGDPDQQHGVEPRVPLGTGRNAQAALGAGAHPGDRLRRRRLAHGEPAQPVRRRLARRPRAGRCGRPWDTPQSRRRRPCTAQQAPARPWPGRLPSSRRALPAAWSSGQGEPRRALRSTASVAGWRPGSDQQREVLCSRPLQRSGTG